MMSVTSENFIYVTETYDDENIKEVKDPLEDLGIYEDNTKYYRLNETVFAEPIAINNEKTMNDTQIDNELCFVNNIMVKKQTGKRNKYLIDQEPLSQSFECPQTNCNKKFTTTTLLRSHIRRVHCVERNSFICEQCGAGFSASYLLQRHMMVHGGEKKECPLCGKMLSKRTNMAAHLRRHARARPHECRVCHRTFLRRSTLDTHVRFVHRTGELACSTCSERFSSRKLLMNHKSCRAK